jgi:hypothetical protein
MEKMDGDATVEWTSHHRHPPQQEVVEGEEHRARAGWRTELL